jgi:uncharacterized membrane protein YtjA (UPF0391 family)
MSVASYERLPTLLTPPRQASLSPPRTAKATLDASQPAQPADAAKSRARAAHVTRSFPMLHYAVVFFVIALIAALFGFGGIAASAAGIGKILFIVFAVLAVASFVYGLIRKS